MLSRHPSAVLIGLNPGARTPAGSPSLPLKSIFFRQSFQCVWRTPFQASGESRAGSRGRPHPHSGDCTGTDFRKPSKVSVTFIPGDAMPSFTFGPSPLPESEVRTRTCPITFTGVLKPR